MKITRQWAMPNKNTFSIKCIKKLIEKYNSESFISIDPFANENNLAKITNDLDKNFKTDYNLDAYDFLCCFEDNSIDLVLFDPPYSPRQVSEVYRKLGYTVNMQTTQSTYWTRLKKEIARVLKVDGICISFAWNTNGIGKKNGFDLIEVLIVAHGAAHNDTLCCVEKKR